MLFRSWYNKRVQENADSDVVDNIDSENAVTGGERAEESETLAPADVAVPLPVDADSDDADSVSEPEKTAEKKPALFTAKMLWALILPLVVEQLLAVTIGMADTLMVTSVGTDIENTAAVSAISLVDSVNLLLIQVFSALATGGAVVASQYLGHGDSDKACRAAKQLLYVKLAASVIIAAVVLIFNRGILGVLFGNIDKLTADNAYTYFWLSALSYPFLAIYNGSAALFRSMRNSKISMYTSIAMNVINFGGNAALIYGAKIGVMGAGIASLVSRFVGGALLFILLFNKKRAIHLDNFKPAFDKNIVKKIFAIGVPTGIENGLFQGGKLVVASLISTMGEAAVAANAISNTLCSFANVPGMAAGLGAVTVIGQCCGAGDTDGAKKYSLKLTGAVYIANIFVCLVLVFAAPSLFSLFDLLPSAITDANLIVITFCPTMAAIWTPAFFLPNALRAAGDVKYTMSVSVVSMLVVRIGAAYLLAYTTGLGVLAVWIAMYLDWAVRAVCFVARFVTGGWKKIKLI